MHVKKLHQLKRMLERKFVLWMLQSIFHLFARILQFLICISWLSATLRSMIDITFLTCLWYFFNILVFTPKDDISSYTSTISQIFMNKSKILILNFQRMKFPSLNLLIILVASLSNDVNILKWFRLNIFSIHII